LRISRFQGERPRQYYRSARAFLLTPVSFPLAVLASIAAFEGGLSSRKALNAAAEPNSSPRQQTQPLFFIPSLHRSRKDAMPQKREVTEH
jgi:hypothetical protein